MRRPRYISETPRETFESGLKIMESPNLKPTRLNCNNIDDIISALETAIRLGLEEQALEASHCFKDTYSLMITLGNIILNRIGPANPILIDKLYVIFNDWGNMKRDIEQGRARKRSKKRDERMALPVHCLVVEATRSKKSDINYWLSRLYESQAPRIVRNQIGEPHISAIRDTLSDFIEARKPDGIMASISFIMRAADIAETINKEMHNFFNVSAETLERELKIKFGMDPNVEIDPNLPDISREYGDKVRLVTDHLSHTILLYQKMSPITEKSYSSDLYGNENAAFAHVSHMLEIGLDGFKEGTKDIRNAINEFDGDIIKFVEDFESRHKPSRNIVGISLRPKEGDDPTLFSASITLKNETFIERTEDYIQDWIHGLGYTSDLSESILAKIQERRKQVGSL